VEPIPADTSVSDLIGAVARTPCGVPVVDDAGRYMGVISKAALLETLDRQTEGTNGNG
jgi:glycine betaine/proline transport system ATP-binding protein